MGAAALSVIPAMASVASSVMTNNANRELVREQNEYDYKKWREYVDEINPVNQVKKLRDAGINPALAMSQGAIDSGNPSSGVPQSHVASADFSPIAQGFRDSVELYQNQILRDSQKENLDAQTDNQRLRNRTQLQRDLMDMLKMYSEVDKNSNEAKLLWSQIQYTDKQIQAFDAQNSADLDLKHSQANEHNAHADYLKAQKEYQNIINGFAPKQQKLLLRNLNAQHDAIVAAANKDNAEAARAAAEKAVADARKEGLDISNDVADSIADAQVDMAFSEADEKYWQSQQSGKRYIYGSVSEKMPVPGLSNEAVPNRPGYARHRVKRKRSKR